MATMTFQINDASTGGINPAVWVTVSENADGTLTFDVSQAGGTVGDLRGLFFDLADESVLKSLVVSAASGDIRIGDDSVKDLGDGANMNGLLGTDKGYDVGIEIGTSGIGKDDVRSYSFTLDSTARDLSLADLSNVDFGVRLTSVGVIGGTRADSSKILESTGQAIELDASSAVVMENSQAGGNLLADVQLSGSTVLTGWSGGEVGAQVILASEGDSIGTLRVNADGSYVLDASDADKLSAGEEITFDLSYTARNQDEATSWSTDSANFTVKVVGTNDGPQASDDDGGAVREDAMLAGSVSANDSDVDRLDIHSWALIDGSFSGRGSLTMNSDGSWSYDADGAYDALNDGESVDLSFQYAMTDNHGSSDVATVTFRVDGSGTVEPPPPPVAVDDFPTWAQDISNMTLIFDQTAGDTKPRAEGDGYYTVKVNVGSTFNDDLDVNIDGVLAALDVKDRYVGAESELLGVVIKGGLQTTQYYAYGDHNGNGAAADILPEDLGFVLPGDNGNVDPTNAIDAGYDYTSLMAA